MNAIVLAVGFIAFLLTFALGFCIGVMWLAWRVARGDFGRLGQ